MMWRAWLMIGFLAASGLARAQDFTINEGLSGAWFNPDTPGQGFLFDVVPADQFVFVAWFTYEVAGTGHKIGAEEHRWLTAQGNYQGANATLTLNRTEGGVFDDPTVATTTEVGTLTVEFLSCTEATVSYDVPDQGLMGTIALQRLTPDVVCGDLSAPVEKAVNVTYVGNAGVVIDDGDKGVVIDGIGIFTSPWVSVPAEVLSQLQNATAPFAHISVTMVSHNHGDHFSTSSVNSFLAADPARRNIIPTQGRGAISPPEQTESIIPARFQSTTIDYDGFRVTVINTRHFNQFGNDFSSVENYVHLVEIEGKRVLHTGDIDYANDNFQAILDAIGTPPDVIILPTFNTLISAANRDLVQQFFPTSQVVGVHFRTSSLALESSQFQTQFPNGTIFETPLETIVLP